MSTTVVSTSIAPSQTGPAWSYSQLKNFETCAKRYLHYNVAKDVVEPETEQLRAGKLLHQHFEDYLLKGVPLPLGYRQHERMLASIKAAPGKLYGEQKLAITGAFEPCSFFAKATWFRTVFDAGVVDGAKATVFDWKDGRVKDDTTQLQLMAAAIFVHMPEVERVKTALVFVNHGEVIPAEFTREDQAEIWSEILPRVRAMQKARVTQEFPPKPSGLCRKYCAVMSCPYHGRGG